MGFFYSIITLVLTFKNGFRDSIIGKSFFLVPRINTHKTCKNSQDRLNTVSTPIPVNPSSSEANKFFCNSVFKQQILSGYSSQTSVTVLKYCKLREGNLSNSADIRGIIKFNPCKHTSATATPFSAALASGGAVKKLFQE